MNVDQAQAFTAPLTAAERDQVARAAAAAGKTLEAFVRDAVLTAAYDPFLAAIERAAETIATRNSAEIRHDFAH
ncbi:hypothetical protein ACIBAC_00020 [Streptomyces sp. NPDC051362]|uniref:hypothetical protein n=1 Tax=Streptomyces sp. NPDC051362 TaxID=3365651 RepID=UPI0037B13B9D